MKSLALALAAFFCLLRAATAQSTNPATDRTLCIATYNLRYASSNGPNAWAERRPLMRELLQSVRPDVLGTQEGLYWQLQEIAADLPDYEWIGLGRDGGSRGEFMAVFFRKARLEARAFDHFWLSDTPNVIGSSTWGNSNRRMVTWIRFHDRQTGNEFFVFNTHFDHQIQTAREKSAALLRERVAALNTSLPALLVGDFNAAAGTNAAYSILTRNGFFKDSWSEAPVRQGEGIGTFNDFVGVPHNGPRIDWILARGEVAVSEAEIVTFSRGGKWPSDHFPYVIHATIGK